MLEDLKRLASIRAALVAQLTFHLAHIPGSGPP
jgi:hypothetical protein